MTTTSEILLIPAMLGSALWTVVTGDTFFPSLLGAGFFTFLRSQSKEESLDMSDLILGSLVALFVGMIAGPYVGSQLPEGEGVVGVGALIASFIGVSFLTKLYGSSWDIGIVLKEIGNALSSIGKRKSD